MKVKCICGYEGEPMKSPSMIGSLIFGWIYAIYYYWIKGRFCPSCGRSYTKEELIVQGYQDPDKTYKILSIIPVALIVLLFLLAMSTPTYYY